MRKYEFYKTSSFLDRNLRKIDSFQADIDIAIKEGVFRLHGLKQKIVFCYYMLHMKRTIELSRKGSHISIKDYYKLTDLWFKIFMRQYRTG